MELIIIDDSRIKLMLTREDMEEYGSCTDIHITPEIFRVIMNDARKKCGYCGMKGRIYIQMYQSREGGCELFVTKLDERKILPYMKALNDGIQSEYRKYIFRGRVIYSFQSMTSLLSACRGLMLADYNGESHAYFDESGEGNVYYLLLEYESPIVGENLGKLCRSSAYYYVNEHCKKFSDDAVKKLSALA